MSADRPLPAPPAALFPERAARERLENLLTQRLLAAAERVPAGSVVPTIDMAQFRAELATFDFAAPQAAERLLEWTCTQLEHGVVHMNHPRYFGLFNPAANFPAQLADRIAGAFNPQLASSGSSPVPVAIEAHVVRLLAQRAGLPADAGGHFTTAGSEANYTALLCALTRAEPRFSAAGVRAFSGPVAMYTSRECQPAWFKIVHQAGVGRDALRLIATDERGQMRAEALAQAVGSDLQAGIVPVMISATAGTTGGGMVDPLLACAEIAREYGLWYHVDAAWGGAALCSERLRGVLAGIERADSLTIDAHKWFATTMGCGMFITRHPAVLSDACRVATDFMPSTVSALDPYLNSVQWSRRFMGLKLFLSLAAAGWQGYAQHVERAVEVIAQIAAQLRAAGWSVRNDSHLAVLCVTPPPGYPPIREIVRRVLASRRAWVAATTFAGQEVIRICATHGEISAADVRELVATLGATRAEAAAPPPGPAAT
jgi:glutamate/tyrosine decarboxylase-like PLP-dependent enzyme